MQPYLVILAAGASSRYGRTKQLEPLGPSGETLLDYAIYDAQKNGFGHTVLVIRPELESVFRKWIDQPDRQRPPVSYVLQRMDDTPPSYANTPMQRNKPWGTGQAVLAAGDKITAPFGVINADDFYGSTSFTILHKHLTSLDKNSTHCFTCVGFNLEKTLSDHGGVSRGRCECDSLGNLAKLTELTNVKRVDSVIKGQDNDETIVLDEDTLVSMNMWGFTPSIFPLLREGFINFLENQEHNQTAEFLLPEVVGNMVTRGIATVSVPRSQGTWFGITHPDDRDRVRAKLRALVAEGIYPERLFNT